MVKQLSLVQQRIFYGSLIGILFVWQPVFSQDQFLFDSLIKSTEKKAMTGFVFEVFHNSYFQCYRKSEDYQHKGCSSVNFYPSNGRCELSYMLHIFRIRTRWKMTREHRIFSTSFKEEVLYILFYI